MKAMTSIARPSTPPPSSFLRVPPTPRHAGDYEPFTARKSSRISAQRAQRSTQTPPPANITGRTARSTTINSPPSTIKKPILATMASSPPPTISKRRAMPIKPATDDLPHGITSFGFTSGRDDTSKEYPSGSTITRHLGMLPTPDKTPKKRPSKQASGISSIARTLFPVRPESVEEAMPSPRKNRKQYSSFTLGEEAEDVPIHIYTDSHERVPEVDHSDDNPFSTSAPAVSEPVRRVSKRRKVTVRGEGEISLEEAEARDDGLIYVFRGKKIFRKFEDSAEGSQLASSASDTDDDVEAELGISARLRDRGSRRNIKPRLLFPTAEQASARAPRVTLSRSMSTHEEEEAPTDIEDVVDTNDLTTDIDTDVEVAAEMNTPSAHVDSVQQTPQAPRFAPASPPTTTRTTRSKDVSVANDHKRTVSPFDSWQRTKGAPTTGGRKRARPVDTTSTTLKRTRRDV